MPFISLSAICLRSLRSALTIATRRLVGLRWTGLRAITAVSAVLLALLMAISPGESRATGAQTSGQAGGLEKVYDVYLGGLWVAEMKINADVEGATYRADAVLETKGLIAALYKASFEAAAEGAVGEGLFTPSRFSADTRNVKKNQSVQIQYANGAPKALQADPAFDPRPWQVDPFAQKDAPDPLSAALSFLANQPKGALCDRQVEVFDGRRRYAILMGEPEKRETGIRCQAHYKRVAGFKPKFMARPDIPFEFWFGEAPDGAYEVQRAMAETPLGVAVVRLRQPGQQPG